MRKRFLFPLGLLTSVISFTACNKNDDANDSDNTSTVLEVTGESPNLPSEYYNYSNQSVPDYISKDNTDGNEITDAGATLGRVLFYDKNLSANNTISCASCHQQENAFSDDVVQSVGLDGGLTGRHSMRLINARFADQKRFFWDLRAESLEDQTTMPIQDHIEMGFSGTEDQPSFQDLIDKLASTDYYEGLFTDAFGDGTITEERMQLALAQFIRSIQSFDSKFDSELATVGLANITDDFPNYTAQENQGKTIYFAPPPEGGAGCNGCHIAPEFDLNVLSHNNGVIGVAGSDTEIDVTNMRSPSLRDVVKSDGSSNGPFMHDGSLATLLDVVNHYDDIPENDANMSLDVRLNPPGPGNQNLNLTDEEKAALVAFLQTLSGTDVYTNEKWSNPFD